MSFKERMGSIFAISKRSTTLILILMIGFSYAYFHPGSDPNQSSRLFLTKALVERQSVEITPDHAKTSDKSFVEGRFYSDKAPGTSFLAVLPYSLTLISDSLFRIEESEHLQRTKLHVVSFAVSGISGVLAAYMVFKCLILLGATLGQAQLLTVGYALGTIMFPFSTMLFGHVATAAMILATFLMIIRAPDRTLSSSEIFACGFLWASAIITEYPLALLVAVQGTYLVLKQRGNLGQISRVMSWSFAGAVIPLVLHSWYVWAAFGSPFASPYSYIFEPVFRAYHSGSFFKLPTLDITYGVFLSRYRGLFFFSPFLVWCFLGYAFWLSNKRFLSVANLCLAQVLVYSSFVCSYYAWHGGGSTGARHIIPIIAFLVIPILPLMQYSRGWSRIVAASVGISVTLMLLCTAVLVHHAPPMWESNPLYRQVLPAFLSDRISLNPQYFGSLFPRADASYNIGSFFGLGGQMSIAVVLVVWLFFGYLLWKCAHRK